MKIEGSVALITGGCSGLGRATVEMCSEHGAKCFFVDLNETTAADIVAAIPTSHFHKCSVDDADAVQAAVAACVAHFGRIDILVNCAGIIHHEGMFTEAGPHPLASYERVMQINTTGTFNFCRFVAF
jgi:NAD(P)-dependent dehydrogenase (short-subunit alcohol dehydrogenase family)